MEQTLTCEQCDSTRFRYGGGKVVCVNCDWTIDGRRPYGNNRQKNTDYSKSRTCQQCGKEYFKDRRINSGLWSVTKYCSPKCQADARRMYPTSKAKQEAFRRKRGRTKISTPETNEKVAKLTRLAMQRPEVQEKIRAPRTALTLERRIEISNNLAGRMPANLSYDNSGYGNVQRGYFDINGTTMYFRSKWEANYALYLDFLVDHKEIYKWEFEPDTFMFEAIKLGTRSYTPDFKVYTSKTKFEYHEVKGYMDSKSKTKLKRFAKYYPQHKLVLIDRDEYMLLKRQIGKVCNFYD